MQVKLDGYYLVTRFRCPNGAAAHRKTAPSHLSGSTTGFKLYVDTSVTRPDRVQVWKKEGIENILLRNSISLLFGSRFTTTYGHVALSNTTRWRKKDGSTRSGCMYKRSWCWLSSGDMELQDPKYTGIGCGTICL